MIRIPPSLDRRLRSLFPDTEERDQFVADTLEEAIANQEEAMPAEHASLHHEPEQDRNRLIGGTLHLFSDGGSRGNPGQAAIAAILEDPVRGIVLDQRYQRIGVETNNVAEYRALIEGLKMARRYQPNRLICHLDSELVVKQVNGEYQVKMETLKPFVDEIRSLAMELPDVIFMHIPRADNHRADALVNKALDSLPAPASMGGQPRVRPPQSSIFERRGNR